MVVIQPCDWQEHDVNFKYCVDLFGRTEDNQVANVRINGFSPFFYLRAEERETPNLVRSAIESACGGKTLRGLDITQELKLDAMRGFRGLTPSRVWKISCPALWMFKNVIKALKNGARIGERRIFTEDIYESNLPPFIRLFHILDIAPASPVTFEADEEDPEEGMDVDVGYTVDYKDLKPAPHVNIPLYVAAYDIETYSESGLFPVASNAGDVIIQMGLSFRWSNDLLKSGVRKVFVYGSVTKSEDPEVEFI